MSCQLLAPKSPRISDLSTEQRKELEQALVHLKEKEFEKAAKIYDKLAQALKGKSVEAMMLFNAGGSYFQLKDCETAVTRYRHMIERSLNQLPLKSRGLIEISQAYECLGDLKSSFLSLKDAGDLRTYLPIDINQIVYPARLSLAYSWFGEKDKAENYKNFALTGVLQSKTRYNTEKKLNQDLSQLFLSMGKSHILQKHLKPKSFVQAFSYHQLYLLQSLFLKDKEWSQQAQKELGFLFDKLFVTLSSLSQKNRAKYKDIVYLAFEEGQKMIQKEKFSPWKLFYNKQTRKIKPLFKK